MRIDFTNVTSFEPFPAGLYPLTVVDVEEKTGKESGNPYLNWTCEVADGEYKGRKVWVITSLSEKALFKLVEFYEACTGIALPKEELDFDEQECIGCTFNGEITLETLPARNEGEEPKQVNKCDKFHFIAS